MDEQTIRAYEEMPREYDSEVAGFWDDFPAAFIETFTGTLPRPARVLNIGSGSGRDGSLLFAAGLNVICLDAARKMVAMSRERGLLSVQGNFLHLPFDDRSFDGVWAYTSLLHVRKNDFPRALSEAARVLKPGGSLALGMIEGNGETYRVSSGVPLPRLFAFYRPAELEKLLAASGLVLKAQSTFEPGGKYTYLNLIAAKPVPGNHY
jgi:ubiquinone/menaquinone biosynthesis C-methylase UbiE